MADLPVHPLFINEFRTPRAADGELNIMAKCWDGSIVICKCGGETVYIMQQDCKYGGDDEVFKCVVCGKYIYIELPE